MAELISEIWEGLRDAGLPEVMLYLPDNSASRCHWDDTAEIGEVRVALLADQDRQIVRIMPVDMCVGIGVASPKGVDPSGYKLFVQNKLRHGAGAPEPEPAVEPPPAPESVKAVAPPPQPSVAPAAPPPPAPASRPDPLASRFGPSMKPQPHRPGYGSTAPGAR